MFNSFFGYFTNPESNIPEAPPLPDLNAKPVLTLEEEIRLFKFKPALGRSKPDKNMINDDDYDMIRITELYIKDILNVKLKPTTVPKRPTKWEPRHPVLQEFARKATLVN